MADFEQVEILLVEDSPADAEMTLRALRRNNLANRVHWVKDGAEALDYMSCAGAYAARDRANGPKLVMLDIKMPKIDGIEVLRRLKGEPATRNIPVVIMTSSNEEGDVVKSYRLGVNSYIVKPLDFSAIADVVRQAGFYWLVINRTPAG